MNYFSARCFGGTWLISHAVCCCNLMKLVYAFSFFFEMGTAFSYLMKLVTLASLENKKLHRLLGPKLLLVISSSAILS
jgi:predicted membrane metal-binding protein